MTKQAKSESRRKLLKQLAAGGGVAVGANSLPELWTKPVVNSVILPAHAQTTPTPTPTPKPPGCEPTSECYLPSGCYFDTPCGFPVGFTLDWPGGCLGEVKGVRYWTGNQTSGDCPGIGGSGPGDMVIAKSAAEAEEFLKIPAGCGFLLYSFGDGCGIYEEYCPDCGPN